MEMYKCAQYVQSVHVEFIRSQGKQSLNVRYQISVQTHLIGLKTFNAWVKGVFGALLIDWQHLSLGDLKQYEFFPKSKS